MKEKNSVQKTYHRLFIYIYINTVHSEPRSVHYYYFYTAYTCVCRVTTAAAAAHKPVPEKNSSEKSRRPPTGGRSRPGSFVCVNGTRPFYWKPSSAIVTWYFHYHGSHSLSEFYYNRFFFFPSTHAHTHLLTHPIKV